MDVFHLNTLKLIMTATKEMCLLAMEQSWYVRERKASAVASVVCKGLKPLHIPFFL